MNIFFSFNEVDPIVTAAAASIVTVCVTVIKLR